MAIKASVNIQRDLDVHFNYQVTENAKRIFNELWSNFHDGYNAFNLIGSYGNGKSSFLWALHQELAGKNTYFGIGKKETSYISIIGDTCSLKENLANHLNCEVDDKSIFDEIKTKSKQVGSDGIVLLQIDEVGKHLEYAAANNPEKEIYFIQKLAEQVSTSNSNVLLIMTLHQSFDAYSTKLNQETKHEWEKVKGRFKELVFNETPESLLEIGASFINAKSTKYIWTNGDQEILKASVLNLSKDKYIELAAKVYPLDVLTGKCLVQAFQRYGQNNRSLFSFLQSNANDSFTKWQELQDGYYNVVVAFDYLYSNFYHYLSTSGNKDFLAWNSILNAIDRANAHIPSNQLQIAHNILKILGLVRLFSNKGAKLNHDFLNAYCYTYLNTDKQELVAGIRALEKAQIIRFRNWEDSFALVEGTDIDIENELILVGERVTDSVDIVSDIKRRINFDPIAARRVSFKTGIPRFFEIIATNEPLTKSPSGEIDGYINLIFSSDENVANIQKASLISENAILFGFYTQTDRIRETLFEIGKVEKLIEENEEDKAAVKELIKIKEHNEALLKLYVVDGMTNNKVQWFFKGDKIIIDSRKVLNQTLSGIIERVYYNAPNYKNELINKNRLSGSIGGARKNFFKQLTQCWKDVDLGFTEDKYPPEKTIFQSLLKETGIHNPSSKNGFDEPTDISFLPIWKAGLDFIEQAQTEKLKVSELFNQLKKQPYGLKNGFLEFWVPTFIFIFRSEFALYEKDTGFQPNVSEGVLNLLSRNPEKFELKSFKLDPIRLNIFNRYREFLQLAQLNTLGSESFIESIKPFLVFYKSLNVYAQKTNRLSKEALNFRKAIITAKDPEKTFFEAFPKALGFSIDSLNDDRSLGQFAEKLKKCANEINKAYNELLKRLEMSLADALLIKNVSFTNIQTALEARYKDLQQGRLTALQRQFIARTQTPINDSESWYASIFQPLIGKPLNTISDAEEQLLHDKIAHIIKELDNLCSLNEIAKEDKEELIKLDLTFGQSLKGKIIRLPSKPPKAYTDKETALKELLANKPEWNLALLAKLLKEEIENE